MSKKESYFENIALLKYRVVACVRHGEVVDQLTSFFGLVAKLVLALSCCKKKQNKKEFYRFTQLLHQPLHIHKIYKIYTLKH